ncbi:MAG: AAA family ATPase [Emticicia sp.]|nr:AAA family ATPase [Emticicia sp.]
MSNIITHIKINNFKSIRYLELSEFRKINLFIGRPNVGKSNLLEALSLFNPSIFKSEIRELPSKKIKEFIRFENEPELFFEGEIKHRINININNLECSIFKDNIRVLELDTNDNKYSNFVKGFFIEFHTNFNTKRPTIKSYCFKTSVKYQKDNNVYLTPPFGKNILQVIESLPNLKQTIINWFRQYNLKIASDSASHSLKVFKKINDDEIFLIPYTSIADTLQRLIFYKTAIQSNENSVLVFEEPEAHSFPPYIVEFTQEVINSTSNQFFMATHSPIIVNDFLENAREDLSIFMVDFRDGQTVAKALSRDEINDVYRYGVDLFFNNEAYTA